MKISIQILIIILTLTIFQSCSKDNELNQIDESISSAYDPTTETGEASEAVEEESVIKDKVTFDLTGELSEVKIRKSFTSNRGNGKSHTWKWFYTADRKINRASTDWFDLSRSNIGTFEIKAELTSQSGDADLYIFGYDVDSGTRREIKSSRKSGNYKDIIEFNVNDLRSHEDFIRIGVYGYKTSYYELQLFYKNGGHSGSCPDTHRIIEKIKRENNCDFNPYKLYKVFYNGRPAYFLDGEALHHYVDIPTDIIYDCDGTVIASNGYVPQDMVIDYGKISSKDLVYKCSGVCSNIDYVVRKVRRDYNHLCLNNHCTVKIYEAKYFGVPSIYVSVECSDLLDIGGGVYNCEGNLVAGESFGSNPVVERSNLELNKLKYKCTGHPGGGTGCKTINEDFESYDNHRKVGPQSNKWTTWSGREGGREDGKIYRGRSGNQTLFINEPGVQDVLYKLGNKKHGKHELSFKIWVTGAGHFNIQKDENNKVAGGVLSATFGTNGKGKIRTNGGGQASFNFRKNTWINVVLSCDFDHNRHTLTIGGRKFTITSARGLQFGAINFYGVQSAKYYVDDIKLKEKC